MCIQRFAAIAIKLYNNVNSIQWKNVHELSSMNPIVRKMTILAEQHNWTRAIISQTRTKNAPMQYRTCVDKCHSTTQHSSSSIKQTHKSFILSHVILWLQLECTHRVRTHVVLLLSVSPPSGGFKGGGGTAPIDLTNFCINVKNNPRMHQNHLFQVKIQPPSQTPHPRPSAPIIKFWIRHCCHLASENKARL